jgi:hypothetical protein
MIKFEIIIIKFYSNCNFKSHITFKKNKKKKKKKTSSITHGT